MKKRTLALGIALLVAVMLSASCANDNDDSITFNARIIYIHENSVTVEPIESEDVMRLSDRTSFGTSGLEDLDVSVGDIVAVAYTGEVMETYPTGINAVRWEILESNAVAVMPGGLIEEVESTSEIENIESPTQPDSEHQVVMSVIEQTTYGAIVSIQNNGDLPIFTGRGFTLEVYDNGSWQSVPRPNAPPVTDDALNIEQNSPLEMHHNFSNILPLEQGTYRIVQSIFIDTWLTEELENGFPSILPIDTRFEVVAEFTVE